MLNKTLITSTLSVHAKVKLRQNLNNITLTKPDKLNSDLMHK